MKRDPVLVAERDAILTSTASRVALPTDGERPDLALAKVRRINASRIPTRTIRTADPRWDGAVRCEQLIRLWRAGRIADVAWEDHPDASVLEIQAFVLPVEALPLKAPDGAPENVQLALDQRHAGDHGELARRLA